MSCTIQHIMMQLLSVGFGLAAGIESTVSSAVCMSYPAEEFDYTLSHCDLVRPPVSRALAPCLNHQVRMGYRPGAADPPMKTPGRAFWQCWFSGRTRWTRHCACAVGPPWTRLDIVFVPCARTSVVRALGVLGVLRVLRVLKVLGV